MFFQNFNRVHLYFVSGLKNNNSVGSIQAPIPRSRSSLMSEFDPVQLELADKAGDRRRSFSRDFIQVEQGNLYAREGYHNPCAFVNQLLAFGA